MQHNDIVMSSLASSAHKNKSWRKGKWIVPFPISIPVWFGFSLLSFAYISLVFVWLDTTGPISFSPHWERKQEGKMKQVDYDYILHCTTSTGPLLFRRSFHCFRLTLVSWNTKNNITSKDNKKGSKNSEKLKMFQFRTKLLSIWSDSVTGYGQFVFQQSNLIKCNETLNQHKNWMWDSLKSTFHF